MVRLRYLSFLAPLPNPRRSISAACIGITIVFQESSPLALRRTVAWRAGPAWPAMQDRTELAVGCGGRENETRIAAASAGNWPSRRACPVIIDIQQAFQALFGSAREREA